jgi:P-type E1-E2 ATPase
VAVIGAISLSARRGIIIKNPAVLEQIDRCRTLIFDKTGTLTYGKPAVSEILCAPGFTKEQVLQAVASLERYSKHPLSRAVLDAAQMHICPRNLFRTSANVRVKDCEERFASEGSGLRAAIR